MKTTGSRSDAAAPAPLKCHNCEAIFGALLPISPDAMRAGLAGTIFAGLAGALPPDLTGTITPVLEFECGACFLRRIEDAKKDQLHTGQVRQLPPGDVQEDSDEEGNPRTVARPARFFGRNRRR